MTPLARLTDAFLNIDDKNALAWSILDTKSESAVVRAISLAANRRAGRRLAWVEHTLSRVDLIFAPDDTVAAFEAKAAYLTDFQPARVKRRDWYLGGCTDDDLAKLNALKSRTPTIGDVFGLFFTYEVADPSKLQKYGDRPAVKLDDAKNALIVGVTGGELKQWSTVSCGEADGTSVNLHMAVFAPR